MPGGAAGHYLLATVLLKSSQEPQAVRHLCAALEADPFCWSAYEQLCALGHAEEAARLLDGARCGFSRTHYAHASPCVLTPPRACLVPL